MQNKPPPAATPVAPPDDTQPPPQESQTLTKDVRAILDAVRKQQRRLSQLEKRFGLPNSLPTGERQLEPHNDSWPLDLNQPVDRASVDKSVSFHDAEKR